MDSAQRELLQRIESFVLDEELATLPFSLRLATHQGWSSEFTHRAIREYKRFAFLAMVAGHPVSPSDPVDQVWHEHLTYTRSYWDEFCGKVLRQPLHHEPTRGGAAEARKFAGWYEQTLGSYVRFFGEEPPVDLWPRRPMLRTVPKCSDWFQAAWRSVASKLWLTFRAARVLMFATMVIGLAGCASALVSGDSVLDYPGSDFLQFFWLLAVAVFAGGAYLRWHFRRPGEPLTDEAPPLDPYAIALLAEGRERAVQAAVSRLVHTGTLRIEGDDRRLILNRPAPKASYPLEQVLLANIDPQEGTHLGSLRLAAAGVFWRMEHELAEYGLLVREADQRRAMLWPLVLVAGLLLLAVVKIFIGVGRDRPVSFLVISCIALLIAGGVAFCRRALRSRYGDAFIESLQQEHRVLTRRPLDGLAGMAGASLPLAVALFGTGVLAQTPYQDLHRAVAPHQDTGASTGGCGGDAGGDGGSGGGDGGSGGCGGCGGD
jgi:uncharacterized protein (TIGR04222 family)